MLLQRHGQNAVALFIDDQLQAIGYQKRAGMMRQIGIKLTSMRGWKTIKRINEKNLGKAACIQDVARYKKRTPAFFNILLAE